ncbi:MAG TPA: glycosyltransferase N-terminal domain-containing protein [Gemmatimonadaceae bacterium]|nr:glycosyltransferase N-terminal domain-containing protein [Gemmatimonadaceae bacterium]
MGAQRPPISAAPALYALDELSRDSRVNMLLRGAYEGAVQLARAAAVVAPPVGGKVVATFRARRGIRARYEQWNREGRNVERPLVWMHASSVGEGLQARPVLELLRSDHAHLQLAYTFFSPSAESFARSLGVDFAEYLPFDSRGDARVALDALSPRVLAFSKLDVWPALVAAARQRGVRTALLSATLASRSRRRSFFSSAFTRGAYAAFDAVGAIDEADAIRLMQLGVRERAITVTGDTRYDQVWARAQRSESREALLAPLGRDRPTLVAGSTWPADERELLPAWISMRAQVPDARLIIAPHEPTPAHLRHIERWAAANRLTLARASALPRHADADVILVDTVGLLGDLYALADVAFVGGGFHGAGLHSVLEPAAFGVPVLFGPRHEKSRDAALLLAADAGGSVSDASAITARLEALLTRPETRGAEGARARAIVEKGLGASVRSAALVTALLDR